MKILFLTIVNIKTLEKREIYPDILRKFRDDGHEVFVVSPVERKYKMATNIIKEKGATLLQIRSYNLLDATILEKGLGILALENQFLRALKKYFSEEKFDLVLYSTPPITFTKVIKYIKSRDNAYSYLLLKDIFPQNAVDLRLMKKGGLMHKFFLRKERQLYEVSDTIGCMSVANRNYLIKHNTYLDPQKVEVNPNTVEPLIIKQKSSQDKLDIRAKYDLPANKMIFIYGGNLGLPQGIHFLLQTIEECINTDAFFLIIGSGKEFNKVEKWFIENEPENAKLLKFLPKTEFDYLIAACDVGMIFLNPAFTIPNFPSRLLSYLEQSMPVLAATDKNTDIGKVIEEAKCGTWVESGDIKAMLLAIDKLIENKDDFLSMKKNARKLLEEKYVVDISCRLILDKVNQDV